MRNEISGQRKTNIVKHLTNKEADKVLYRILMRTFKKEASHMLREAKNELLGLEKK